MNEDVANAVARHFGSVHFVRELLTSIPNKLNALVSFLAKFMDPEDEFYQNTILKLKEVPSSKKEKRTRTKRILLEFSSQRLKELQKRVVFLSETWKTILWTLLFLQ